MSQFDVFPSGDLPFKTVKDLERALRRVENERNRLVIGVHQEVSGTPSVHVEKYEWDDPSVINVINLPDSHIRVESIPPEAQSNENAFRAFITPLLAEADLVDRAKMVISGENVEIVVTRPLAAPIPQPDDLIGATIAKANEEWEWFGREEYALNGERTKEGKREDADDASERVKRYWVEGRTGEKFTGKDRKQPWSAAFISFVMAKGGMGSLFTYSIAHREYIHAAIKARRAEKRNTGYWAYELPEQSVEVGDLICAGRETEDWKRLVTFEDAVAGRGYPSHCDLVVAKNGDVIETIGGNVGQSVSKKRYRLVGGKLTEANFNRGFALLKNITRTVPA
jgi:hypothetical protein